MQKEDLIFIATYRHIAETKNALWQKKSTFLESLIGNITARESELIERQKEERMAYNSLKLSELKTLAKKFRIPYSNRTRNGIIDELILGPINYIALTGDQNAFVEKWQESALILSGKIGSGKTLSLCALIHKICSAQTVARILLLTRNKDSEKKCEKFLYYFGVFLQPTTQLQLALGPGCFCMTMQKWTEIYSETLHKSWDWILVDDADILLAEGYTTYIRNLYCLTNHYVATETNLDPNAPAEHGLCTDTHQLGMSLRSTEQIVYFLNWLECEYICKETWTENATRYTLPQNNVNKEGVYFCSDPILAGEFMIEFHPQDAYAIGDGQSEEARILLQYIKNEKPDSHVIILDEETKSPFQNEPVYIITPLSNARGTERPCTIVLANNILLQGNYPTFRKAIIALYEACACAKTDLVIVISPQLEFLIFGHLPNRMHLKRKYHSLSTISEVQKEVDSSDYQFPLYAHRSNTIVGYISRALMRKIDRNLPLKHPAELDKKYTLARAEIAMQESANARKRMQESANASKQTPYRLKHWLYSSKDIFIAVDTEDDGKGILTELAAVAFIIDSSGRAEIIDTFYKLAEGVLPNKYSKKTHSKIKENFDAESYTALIISDRDRIRNYEPLLLHEFRGWCNDMRQTMNDSNNKKTIFLHWGGGGSEAKLFDSKKKASEILDVAYLYKIWLEHTNQLRSFSLTLENAVHHLLGMEVTKFVPHRALEDTVITAAIFHVISDV